MEARPPDTASALLSFFKGLSPTLSSCVVVVCFAHASYLYNAPFLLPHFDVMCVSALQCHTLVSCIYYSISAVTVVTKAYVALTKHKPAG